MSSSTCRSGDDIILGLRGFGEAALVTLKEHLAKFEATYTEEVVGGVTVDATVAETNEVDESEAEAETAVIEEEVMEEVEAVIEAEEIEEVVEEAFQSVNVIDDLSQSLVQEAPKPAPEKKKGVVIARQTSAEKRAEEAQKLAEEEAEKTRKSRSRELVFDEAIGEVVSKRKRKGSRRQQEWDDFDVDDF